MIKTAFATGGWNGVGLTSGAAATASTSGHPTALGYAEASTTPYAGNSFDGVSTDGDMILVRYTASGDANLDGTVGTNDFMALSQNFNTSGAGVNWINGDFNYDGVVNALDFNLLATNFGQSILPGPALGTLVPEPASIGLLAVAGLAMRRRRCA